METNKIGRFVCRVLATYGLVVACGNMKEKIPTVDETLKNLEEIEEGSHSLDMNLVIKKEEKKSIQDNRNGCPFNPFALCNKEANDSKVRGGFDIKMESK